MDDSKYLQTFVVFRYGSDNKTDLKALQALIKAGADVEVRNGDGDTPLLKAARFQSSGAALVLLDGGADVNARNNADDTPLLLAAYKMYGSSKKRRKRRNIELLNMLVGRGADRNATGSEGKTAYDFLLERGFSERETAFLKP